MFCGEKPLQASIISKKNVLKNFVVITKKHTFALDF